MTTTANPLRSHPLLNRLIAARELAGLSQTELGVELGPGYGRATVSKIERGVKELEPTTLEGWAEACGVHMDFFLRTDFSQPTAKPEPLPAGTTLTQAVAVQKKRIATALRAGS